MVRKPINIIESGSSAGFGRNICIFAVTAAANLLMCILLPRIASVCLSSEDSMMRITLSGLYSGVPSAAGVSVNPLLARVLTRLYQLRPEAEWLGILFYAGIGTSATVMETILLRGAGSAKDLLKRSTAAAFFSLCFVAGHLLMPTTAAAASYFAALSIASCREYFKLREKDGRFFPAFLWGLLSVVSAVISFMLREFVFLCAAPLIILMFVYSLLRARQSASRRTVFLLTITLAILGSAIAGMHLDHSIGTREQKACLENYERVLSKYGLADYEENKAFYERLDISEEAYQCMLRKMYGLSDELTLEKLGAAADYTENLNREALPRRIIRSAAAAFDALSDNYVKREFLAFALMCLILFVFCSQRRISKSLTEIGGAFIYGFLCMAVLGFRNRMDADAARVILILFTPVVLSAFSGHEFDAQSSTDEKTPLSRIGFSVLTAILCLAVAASSFVWWQDDTYPRQKLLVRTEMMYEMEQYMQDYPDGFMFYRPMDFVTAGDLLFTAHHQNKPLHIDSLGNRMAWTAEYARRNEQFGFEKALDAFLGKENVFYAQQGRSITKVPVTIALQRYGKTLEEACALQAGDYEILIYRIVDIEESE